MGKISKNSRSGVTTEKHYCSCKGEIKMHSTFAKGKMKHFARCEKCGTEKRRPKEFN